jgi:hypothetical protein
MIMGVAHALVRAASRLISTPLPGTGIRMTNRRKVILAISLALGIVAALSLPKPLPEISRAEFMTEVREGRVRQIVIVDQDSIHSESSTRGKFRTPYDKEIDKDLAAQLQGLGVEVLYEKSTPGLI